MTANSSVIPDAAESTLVAAAASVFPGGILGSFRLPHGQEIVAERGMGSRLRAVGGREYIDYVLGSGPLILGHAHPAVVEALVSQVEAGTTFYTLNEPAIELGAEVLRSFPAQCQLLFTSSGSEATFYAMRLARAITGREKIVKFAGAYHGHHDYAVTEMWARKMSPGDPLIIGSAGVPRGATSTVLVAPFNDRAAVTMLFEEHRDEIAAVIVEPYQRVIEPEAGFLQFLRDTTTAAGSLLIADEVVTGFRFHYGTAQSLYGINADLTALGKIIGGGLPLAAIVGTPDAMRPADSARSSAAEYAYVSGTLNGNALAAAAGVATLKVLRGRDTYERLSASGERIRTALVTALLQCGFDVQPLGRGPMFHLAFRGPVPIRNAADLAAADRELCRRFLTLLLEGGLFVNPGQRNYVSLAHDEQDLAETEGVILSAAKRLTSFAHEPTS